MSKKRRKKNTSRATKSAVEKKCDKKAENTVYTIKIDESQKEQFLDELTERIEWSTNRIVDESPRPALVVGKRSENDSFSTILRIALFTLFCGFGLFLIIGTVVNWSAFWTGGVHNFAVLCVLLIGIVCLSIGIDILRERDRDYLVSLFSALVALVALIIAILK